MCNIYCMENKYAKRKLCNAIKGKVWITTSLPPGEGPEFTFVEQDSCLVHSSDDVSLMQRL